MRNVSEPVPTAYSPISGFLARASAWRTMTPVSGRITRIMAEACFCHSKPPLFDRPNEWIGRFIAGNSTTVVCPMSYESERLRSVITSIITCWNGRVIEELGDYIFMISSMFKNDSWKSEKEYRYFVHRSYPEILKSPYYKTHQRGGDVIPYLDLPIRSWDSVEGLPIYRICLGPAAPPEVEGRVAASLIAVGTPITGRPPHRTVRAAFLHTAPTSDV
jgi:hypothetical protein